MREEVIIRNIKFSFRLKSAENLQNRLKALVCSNNIKFHGNFAVLRLPYGVFSIWYGGFFNCTKQKNLQVFAKCLYKLGDLLKFNPEIDCLNIKANNISATGKVNIPQSILFSDLISSLNLDNALCSIRYDLNSFPGAVLKFRAGTFILFKSGKYISVGSKSPKRIKECLKQLKIELKLK